MYWDGEKSTYLPAPASDNQAPAPVTAVGSASQEEQKKDEDQKKRPPTPEKKVKIAKKIVKACNWWPFVDGSKYNVILFITFLHVQGTSKKWTTCDF